MPSASSRDSAPFPCFLPCVSSLPPVLIYLPVSLLSQQSAGTLAAELRSAALDQELRLTPWPSSRTSPSPRCTSASTPIGSARFPAASPSSSSLPGSAPPPVRAPASHQQMSPAPLLPSPPLLSSPSSHISLSLNQEPRRVLVVRVVARSSLPAAALLPFLVVPPTGAPLSPRSSASRARAAAAAPPWTPSRDESDLLPFPCFGSGAPHLLPCALPFIAVAATSSSCTTRCYSLSRPALQLPGTGSPSSGPLGSVCSAAQDLVESLDSSAPSPASAWPCSCA